MIPFSKISCIFVLAYFPTIVLSQDKLDIRETVTVSERACDRIRLKEGEDPSSFDCYALRNANSERVYTLPETTDEPHIFLENQTIYVVPETHIARHEFTIEVPSKGFLSFEMSIRGSECEIPLIDVRSEGEVLFQGSPQVLLVDQGSITLKTYLFDPSPEDSSCVLGVRPFFSSIEDVEDDLFVWDFRLRERQPDTVARIFDLGLQLQDHLRNQGFGDYLDLSSVRVQAWNGLLESDPLRAERLVGSLCVSYMEELTGLALSRMGVEIEARSELQRNGIRSLISRGVPSWDWRTPKLHWAPDLRQLELNMALYQSLSNGGFYDITGSNDFVPDRSTLCYGAVRGLPSPQDLGHKMIAVGYSFFDDDVIGHPTGEAFTDFKIHVAIEVRKFFRAALNLENLTILNRVVRPDSSHCSGYLDIVVIQPTGAPVIIPVNSSSGCPESGGAQRFLENEISAEKLQSFDIDGLDPALPAPQRLSATLTNALAQLDAEVFGDLIVLDDTDDQYTEIQLIGDRGRVLPSSPAWESSFVTAAIVNNQRLIVRVETFIASRAGEVGPRSLEAYETSADIDYRGDVQLFVEKLASELVKMLNQ